VFVCLFVIKGVTKLQKLGKSPGKRVHSINNNHKSKERAAPAKTAKTVKTAKTSFQEFLYRKIVRST
jgi:hypothetical protein